MNAAETAVSVRADGSRKRLTARPTTAVAAEAVTIAASNCRSPRSAAAVRPVTSSAAARASAAKRARNR